MYLHLGQDVVVRQQDIVGVFDIENTTISRDTRAFLTTAEQEGRVITITPELPRSFAVCAPPADHRTPHAARQDRVYISQISPKTLAKRAVDTETDD